MSSSLEMQTFHCRDGHTRITVVLSDCMEGMSSLVKPESVDVIVTSPPYNIGVSYSTYDDTIDRATYLEFISSWADLARQCLSPHGSLFLNMGGKPTDPWIPWEVAQVIRGKMKLQNVIHWIKAISIDHDSIGGRTPLREGLSVGHYKPVNSNRFVNDCHEYVFHFTKTGRVPLDRLAVGVPYQNKSNIGRWQSATQDLRCRGNTWFIPYETIQNRQRERPHPATFPVRLPEMCIKLHGLDRCKLVMDPFLGLGNTALACLNLGKEFIGFEMDRNYYEDAKSRISSAESAACAGQPSLFDTLEP